MFEFESLLACPTCTSPLVVDREWLSCERCGRTYSTGDASSQPDLRLHAPKPYTATFELGTAEDSPPGELFSTLPPNPDSQIADWRHVRLPRQLSHGNRLSPELISYFPRANEPGHWMLDLGCGRRTFEDFCRKTTGFGYVGVDYDGAEPDILADAHALPFLDRSFDFVISIAVLEHLAFPDIAMREAFRTLKPGGTFIGTVAFLEPFHLDSHFHMTHLGTARVLRHAGFEIQALAPNHEWTGLRAQSEMSLFPGLPPATKRLPVAPIELASRLLWRIKRRATSDGFTPDHRRLLHNTAGFRFVARRPH